MQPNPLKYGETPQAARRAALRPTFPSATARPLFAAAVVATLVGVGCPRSQAPEQEPVPLVERIGELTELRGTPLVTLREEIARIEEEKGLPRQLTEALPPPDDNLAAVFVDLFPADRLPGILAEAEQYLSAGGGPDAHPDALRGAKAFRERFEPQRISVRRALRRPTCVFPVRFTAGYAADLGFLDQVAAAMRLEALFALEAAGEGRTNEAADSVISQLQLAAALAACKHPQVRFTAARHRAAALNMLQEVVLSKPLHRDDMLRVLNELRRQIAVWPADADAWIGFRALGLHALETAKRGRLYDILTNEEVAEFQEHYDMKSLVEQTRKNADADALYFVRAMARVIEISAMPYTQRRAELDRLATEWTTALAGETPPIVSCRVLLPEVPPGHEIQARDRANLEAWLLAVRTALQEPPAQTPINPWTGEPYQVEVHDGWVYVQGIGTGEVGRHAAIEIPLLPAPGRGPPSP
ncbi:hypothetical protein [Thermopirellula anaerolimosa]